MSESTNERRRRNNTKKPTLSKRAISLIAGAVLVVLVGGSVAAWQLWPTSEKAVSPSSSPAKPPTKKPFATPAPSGPIALTLDAETSDEFDWWKSDLVSDQVKFLASDDAHDGAFSVAIVSSAPQGESKVAQIEQAVSAAPGTTYEIAFWAKSVDAGWDAIEVLPSQDGWSSRISVPGGTYDWTRFSTEYTVPQGESMFIVRIAVKGPTAGTWIDQVEINDVTNAAQSVVNNGFESNSADLTVVNNSLMFPAGAGTLEVFSRRAPDGWFRWSVKDESQAEVAVGEELISGNAGSVDLSELTPGYYTVTLDATLGDKVVNRSTALAVYEGDMPAEASQLFGVSMHLHPGEKRLPNLIRTLGAMGVTNARIETQWGTIEKEKGSYVYPELYETAVSQFAESGIEPLLVAGYSNPFYDGGLTPSSAGGLAGFANYSKDLLGHYSAATQSIEIYNEFDHVYNTGACGPTAACYVEMLEATAPKIREAVPGAQIVGPGNSGMGFKTEWLKQFLDLGGLQYVDAVSAHPYVQPEPPEVLIEDLTKVGEMIRNANGGTPKPIWFTEMGWATVPDWVTVEQQSDYLVRTMAISAAHGVERVYWYSTADLSLHEGDRESNFGIFEAGSSFTPNAYAPKQAALSQAVMARQLAGAGFTLQEDVGAGAYSYVFGEGSAAVRMLWSTSDSPQQLKVQTKKAVTVTDSMGGSQTLKPKDGAVIVDVSGSPIYVSGSVTKVSRP